MKLILGIILHLNGKKGVTNNSEERVRSVLFSAWKTLVRSGKP